MGPGVRAHLPPDPLTKNFQGGGENWHTSVVTGPHPILTTQLLAEGSGQGPLLGQGTHLGTFLPFSTFSSHVARRTLRRG